MPKSNDPAHKETDKILSNMEKQLNQVYKQAYREARATADDFMKQFREKDKQKRQQIKDETDKEKQKELKADYERWRRTQVFQGNRYHQMADTLAADMTNTNKIAASVINGHLPDVYAVNHNYGTYEVENGSNINTQYTLYDRQTVERLMRDNPDLLPRKAAVNVPKDEQWSKQHINSAVLQGILQGKSNDDIAKDLATTITTMSHTSAIRNARTMTTSAENGGRIDSYKRAESMGIKMVQVWVSTLDDRTRHEHIQLDGQKRKVGEPFVVDGYKIDFPGDPSAEPFLVYNCRCCLIGQVEGINFDLSDTSQRDSKLGNMTYEEWKDSKRKQDEGEPDKPKQPDKQEEKPQPEKEQEPAVIDVPAPEVEKPDAVDEPIKPQANIKAKATNNTILARNESYEYHRTHNNLNLVSISDIDIDKVFPVNYGNLSEETTIAFSNTLNNLMNEYDTQLRTIRIMTREEYAALNSSFAVVSHDYRESSAEMLINPVKCKDSEKLIERIKDRIENGYFVDVPEDRLSEYVPTHEFAHTILGMTEKLNDKTNWANDDYKKIKEVRKEISDLYNNYLSELEPLQTKFDELTEKYFETLDESVADELSKVEDELKILKISEYSLENADEFMAEAFTQAKLSEKQSKYSVEVMKVLDSHFKR